MMRAPYRTSVGPTHQPLAFLSSAGATPEAFGAGIGQAIAQIGGILKTREDQTNRFSSLRNFSEFETRVNERLTELKRDADPSGKGFLQSAEAEYDQLESQFLANDVTPELQDEFRTRAGQVKQRLVGDALDFQYKAGDAFFKQGVSDELNKAQIALDKDPTQLEDWRKRMGETIAATDLSDIEKEDLARQVNIGLESVSYRQNIKAGKLAEGETLSSSTTIGQMIDAKADEYGLPAEVMRKIAWIESRGNPNAHNAESGAAGIFQFIPSTAKDYGLTNPFDAAANIDAGMRYAKKSYAYWNQNFGRDPTAGELYLMHQQGPAGAKALIKNPNAMATNIVGRDAVVGNGGSSGMTAGEFANLWMRQVEGAGTDLSRTIDEDPAYAHIPYEDRLALRKDAENEAQREMNEVVAQQKAQTQAQLNDLLNGIADGTKGQMDANQAYNEGTGWLKDYDDRMKVQRAIDTKNGETNYVTRGLGKLESGSLWNPMDEDDKKSGNALVNYKSPTTGRSMLDMVGQADQAAFSTNILPLIQQMHDVPTDLAGTLMAMVRSSNNTHSLFALDALRQLQDVEPRAFDQRFDEQMTKDVSMYRSIKDLYPSDQVISMVNGGLTAEERQRTLQLREEGMNILQAKKGGVSHLIDLINDFVGDQEWGSTARSAWPASARALDIEYQNLFVEGYSRIGNEEGADAYAREALQKNWAVTEVGGVLMKNPPEKVGYPKIADSYQWIDTQARTELGLKEDERYELISDEKTADEWRKFQAGQQLGGLSPAPQGQFTGQVEPGNIDLAKRPVVKNADGSISTVKTLGVNFDGKETLIPTVSPDGRILSNEDAIKLYKETGQHLGKFETIEQANAYAQALHEAQARYYGGNRGPSYQVVTFDANGVPRLRAGSNGQPVRLFFVPTEVDKAADVANQYKKQSAFDLQDFMNKTYFPAVEHSRNTGIPIPDDIQEEFERRRSSSGIEPAKVPEFLKQNPFISPTPPAPRKLYGRPGVSPRGRVGPN